MGQLLSLISGSDNAEKVFIDFESMYSTYMRGWCLHWFQLCDCDFVLRYLLRACSWSKAEPGFAEATPSDDEKALHDQVAEVLNKAPVILDRLRKYAGCEEYIRKVCGHVN